MSVKPGKPDNRRLADMTIYPPAPEPYVPPPPDECLEFVAPIVLARGHELRVRYLLWKDSFVAEFATMQVTWHSGRWRQVGRIDTDHSKVHRHQLHEHNPDDTQGDIEDLAELSAEGGVELVDRWYVDALDLMENSWEEYLRRWEE